MDPFAGSGTVAAVSIKHGRRSIGIDLNETYLMQYARARIGRMLTELGSEELMGHAQKEETAVDL